MLENTSIGVILVFIRFVYLLQCISGMLVYYSEYNILKIIQTGDKMINYFFFNTTFAYNKECIYIPWIFSYMMLLEFWVYVEFG